MERKDPYQQLINRLQSLEPQLKDEAAFNRELFDRLHAARPTRWLAVVQWLRPVLSSAAVLLLALFVYLETGDQLPPALQKQCPPTATHVQARRPDASCINAPGLFEVYRCLQKERRRTGVQASLAQNMAKKLPQ